MNKVSIIIINYNSSNFTINCINSIYKYTPIEFNYEIIIIDNNSENNDYAKLKEFIGEKEITFFRTKINIGFSGGNMQGVHLANAEYYYFLNNDCVLLNDNLSILYDFMKSEKSAGICVGQMYNPDNTFHHSFNYFPTLSLKLVGSGILRLFNPLGFPKRKVEYLSPIQVPYVTGAGMFIDASKLTLIGGLDTNLFLYHEEEDIAMSFKKKNFKCFLVPTAKFIHFRGQSTKINYSVIQEDYISLLYYFRKHYSFLKYNSLKLNYFIKIIKKSFKNTAFLKLAIFVLCGAPMKYSLRFKQGKN